MDSFHTAEALVADIGTHCFRVGFAGDDAPRANFPSYAGLVAREETTGAAATSSSRVSFNIGNFNEHMALSNVLSDGIVQDTEMFDQIWSYGIDSYVKADVAETPVLLAEKSYIDSKSRMRMAELMFEKYQTPALFLSKDSTLQCFACGRTSGIVVDAGANGTTVSPVIDGWVDAKNIQRSAIGGRYLDSYTMAIIQKTVMKNNLSRLLNSNNKQSLAGLHISRYHPIEPLYKLSRSLNDGNLSVRLNERITQVHPTYDIYASLEVGRDLKQAVAVVAEQRLEESDPKYSSIPTLPYELPDGTVVDLAVERFRIPEVYFDPVTIDSCVADVALLLGQQYQSSFDANPRPVHRLVVDSVLRCESDNQAGLFANIVVAGGGACLTNFSERLKTEVEGLVHPSAPATRVKLAPGSREERALTAWLGGSIVGSLSSFHEMWFTKAEYNEHGAALVDRKLP